MPSSLPAVGPFMGTNFWGLLNSGGFSVYVLLLFSVLTWGVIFERLWSFRRLGSHLKSFYLEALNAVLRNDFTGLRGLCQRETDLPTSQLLTVALDRLSSKDQRVREKWLEAIERKRQLINLDLRRNLWILGTIGASAPFVGLFGTVVGILRSFQEMAKNGSGGFTVVAAGISESLIATAAGIIVAVISVLAFNAFQTRWSHLVLNIRLQTEELTEMLASAPMESGAHSTENANEHR